MIIADAINASFEVLGALFVLNHCRVLHNDKKVSGVSILSVMYFTLWGFWNIYYYPSLGQMLSFYAGIAIVITNVLYVSLLLRYVYND